MARQMRRGGTTAGRGPAVDAQGAPVFDPTENVLALVDVEKAHGAELRRADKEAHTLVIAAIEKGFDYRLADERRFQDTMRAAEIKRTDDLAAQATRFMDKIDAILTSQVKQTSDLVSTNLDKFTSSLSGQIAATGTQIGERVNIISDRVGRLEEQQWTGLGRTSVRDPAVTEALTRMAEAVNQLGTKRDESKGASSGFDRIITLGALIFSAVMAYAAFQHQPAVLQVPAYQKDGAR